MNKPKAKEIRSMEFETTVRAQGNGAHIYMPKSFVGKRCFVSVRVLE